MSEVRTGLGRGKWLEGGPKGFGGPVNILFPNLAASYTGVLTLWKLSGLTIMVCAHLCMCATVHKVHLKINKPTSQKNKKQQQQQKTPITSQQRLTKKKKTQRLTNLVRKSFASKNLLQSSFNHLPWVSIGVSVAATAFCWGQAQISSVSSTSCQWISIQEIHMTSKQGRKIR